MKDEKQKGSVLTGNEPFIPSDITDLQQGDKITELSPTPATADLLQPDPVAAFILNATNKADKQEVLSTSIHASYSKMLKKYFGQRGATSDFINNAIKHYLTASNVTVNSNGDIEQNNQSRLFS